MKQYVEHAGVMMEVVFTPPAPEIPALEFLSVRVVDQNYRAVGPDLMPMLHQLLVIRTPPKDDETRFDAETFLNFLVTELGL